MQKTGPTCTLGKSKTLESNYGTKLQHGRNEVRFELLKTVHLMFFVFCLAL